MASQGFLGKLAVAWHLARQLKIPELGAAAARRESTFLSSSGAVGWRFWSFHLFVLRAITQTPGPGFTIF